MALGAFGAHGLKQWVTPESIAVFQTGVQYQMYHALALVLVGLLGGRIAGKWIRVTGYFFLLGVFFFSGSLYTITAFHAADRSVPVIVGILTPLGGTFFIAGWLSLFLGTLARPAKEEV